MHNGSLRRRKQRVRKNIGSNNGLKPPKLDEICKYFSVHPRILMNSKEDKLKLIHIITKLLKDKEYPQNNK